MAAVTVLSTAKINQRRVGRRLVRAGYAVEPHDGGLQIARHGRWDAVTTTTARIDDLRSDSIATARRLLGYRPRTGVTCSFEGSVGSSDSWPTVVDIARAIAAEVPLAVVDDHAGTTYLVNAKRGLIGPDEYQVQMRGRATTTDFLRRLLGGS
jgi:hypothetical protein